MTLKRLIICLCVLLVIGFSYNLYCTNSFKKAMYLYNQGDYFTAGKQLDYVINYKNIPMIDTIKMTSKVCTFYDTYKSVAKDNDHYNALLSLVNGITVCNNQKEQAKSEAEKIAIELYLNKYINQIVDTYDLSKEEIDELISMDSETRKEEIKTIAATIQN